MRIAQSIAVCFMLAMPVFAFAGETYDNIARLPEPETLGLIGGAALAWMIVRWIKRK